MAKQTRVQLTWEISFPCRFCCLHSRQNMCQVILSVTKFSSSLLLLSWKMIFGGEGIGYLFELQYQCSSDANMLSYQSHSIWLVLIKQNQQCILARQLGMCTSTIPLEITISNGIQSKNSFSISQVSQNQVNFVIQRWF